MVQHSSLFISLDYNVGRFDCSSASSVCNDLYVTKRPAFILFKRDGHYEFYYGKYRSIANRITRFYIQGRQTSSDLAGFVRDNALSPLRTLTPSDFPTVQTDPAPYIIDFFSPVRTFEEAVSLASSFPLNLVLPTVYASTTRISQSIKTTR
jgi:hypothetical protein